MGTSSEEIDDSLERASNIGQTSPVSDKSPPPTSHEAVTLECLMDRWSIADADVWQTIFASLAPKTQKSYRINFRKFLIFMRDESVNIDEVTLTHVFRFLKPMVDQKMAASTLRSYVVLCHAYMCVCLRVLDNRLNAVRCDARLPY